MGSFFVPTYRSFADVFPWSCRTSSGLCDASGTCSIGSKSLRCKSSCRPHRAFCTRGRDAGTACTLWSYPVGETARYVHRALVGRVRASNTTRIWPSGRLVRAAVVETNIYVPRVPNVRVGREKNRRTNETRLHSERSIKDGRTNFRNVQTAEKNGRELVPIYNGRTRFDVILFAPLSSKYTLAVIRAVDRVRAWRLIKRFYPPPPT